jgi:cobalt-zinc-cadmium efflux system outer membrane protein
VVLASGARPYETQLTMREAVGRAIRYSPLLRAASAELDAKHAEAFQAGRMKNPEFEGEIENFAGSGEFQGFKSAETTIGLAQVIELGGKRIKRVEVADLGAALAAWDFEAVRLRVATQTAQLFIDVLAGQRRVVILGEFVALNQKFRESVSERVKAGRASEVELQRADVELALAKVQLAEDRSRLDVFRRQLSLSWGSQQLDFGEAIGSLAMSDHLPDADRLSSYLDRHPDVARWSEEMAQREAIHRLAMSQAVPDLTVGASVRRLDETQDTAAVARVGIGLPVFDRNRGNVEAAGRRIAQSEYQRQAARNALTSRFIAAYGLLQASEAKLRALQDEVIPAAEKANEATEQGYREGKFDLLRVLDAQRSLIQARLDMVNTRAQFHKAKTRVEALVGRGLYGL